MKHTKHGSRDGSIDLIKSVAIVSVLFIHAFTSCFRSKLGTPDWYGGMFLSAAARAGVPLFLMATGALMLRPEKELTLKRIYTRYLPRLLIALFFWAFVYHVYDLWETGMLTADQLWFRFKRLFFFDHEQHLYYLHIILLFYAMLPVLRIFTKHADRQTLRYALGIWFATGILLPVLRGYYPYNSFTGIPVQWMLNMTWASMGYGLLGYLISTGKGKRWVYLLLLLTGLAATYGGTVLATLKKGSLDDRFYPGLFRERLPLRSRDLRPLQNVEPEKRPRSLQRAVSGILLHLSLAHAGDQTVEADGFYGFDRHIRSDDPAGRHYRFSGLSLPLLAPVPYSCNSKMADLKKQRPPKSVASVFCRLEWITNQ